MSLYCIVIFEVTLVIIHSTYVDIFRDDLGASAMPLGLIATGRPGYIENFAPGWAQDRCYERDNETGQERGEQ